MDTLPGQNRLRHVSRELRDRARLSRREATDAVRVLWNALRRKQLDGLAFRRQHPVSTFILDFYCPEYKLAIEVDGSIHDDCEVAQRDALRADIIRACGYRIVRFRNEEIMTDLPGVLHQILRATVST